MLSPAKINLFLRIVGRRPDGYHDLETVMVALDFGDEITLQRRDTGLTLECDHPDLPTDDSNLALRAAKALAQSCQVGKGVHILLRKRIPLASGLGGGSSNAATVLQGLNRFWGAEAPAATLAELADGMGSDINFFLGTGAAVCRGRGEQVEPVPCRLSAAVLLVNPGFGIPSKWAYQTWSQMGEKAAKLTGPPPPVSLLVRALAENDLAAVSRALFNDLEAPALRKFPVLAMLKQALIAQGAAGAMMSGSGATVFGLFADAPTAENAAGHIREEFGPSMWTQATKLVTVE